MPGEKEGETPQATPAKEEKTFTQAELERILKERVARVEKKYEDYDQLKEDASEWRTHMAEQQSDVERMQAQLAEEKTRTQTLAEEMAELRKKTAVITEASEKNVIDTEAVWKLLDMDALDVVDGKVVGVAEAVDTLLEEKPYLVKSARPTSSTTSPARPPTSTPTKPSLHDEIMREIEGDGWQPPEVTSKAWDPDWHLEEGGGVLMSGVTHGKNREDIEE